MTTVTMNGVEYPYHYGVKATIKVIDKGINPKEQQGTYNYLLHLECINEGIIKKNKETGGTEKLMTEDEFEAVLDENPVENITALSEALDREVTKKTS